MLRRQRCATQFGFTYDFIVVGTASNLRNTSNHRNDTQQRVPWVPGDFVTGYHYSMDFSDARHARASVTHSHGSCEMLRIRVGRLFQPHKIL